MRLVVALAAVAVLAATPARAQEIQPGSEADFLSVLGDFILDGLSPPRTAADLAREEEKARAASLKADDAPAAVAPPLPAPVAIEPPPEQKTIAAPTSPPVSSPSSPPAAEPAALPAVTPPVPEAPPPVVAAPAPRPQPIVVPRPAAEPIPAADRIAGTATLEQAVKLGGPMDLYTRRPPQPAEGGPP